MFPYIVADIGGTNARFALATARQGQKFVIEHISILSGGDFASFQEALASYIASLNGVKVSSACVAIAGPIEEDLVKMTNLSWEFSKTQVKKEFGFDIFEVINDFTAVAVASSRLEIEDVQELKEGTPNSCANKAILGAGTGLGVAGLAFIPSHASWLPIPSEGGHINLAPATEFEAELIKTGIRRFEHVSAETFLSGPGLVNLYQTICELNGEKASKLQPKDVTAKALAGEDKACVQSLETFCSFFGAMSGNLALTYGAKGGVYVAGGIVPRFVEFLRDSEFITRFREKGIMSYYVEDIPVSLISYEQTAFLGAAAWLDQIEK